MNASSIEQLFGACYFESSYTGSFLAPDTDPYSYGVFIGPQQIIIERGDCGYILCCPGSFVTVGVIV